MAKNSMKITALKLGKESDERIVVDFSNVINNDIILDGNFTGKRSDVDTLSFSILKSHSLYDWLTPLDTFIYFNRANRWEFCGRILTTSTVADNQGIRKEIACESMEALLNDYVSFETLENLGSTPDDTIEKFIEMYNATQPSLKQIKHISFDEKMYEYTDFVMLLDTGKSAVECLYTYLDRVNATMNIRRYDAEIDDVELNDTDLVMNVYHKENDVFRVNQSIQIGVNMQEITSDVDFSKLINKLKVIGKDEISTVVENKESQEKYGMISSYLDMSDLETQEALNEYANDYLSIYSQPFITIKTKPYDFSFIDNNLDSFKDGNIVRVINPVINIDEELHIEELSYNILNYYDTTVTVSNKQENYLSELLKI